MEREDLILKVESLGFDFDTIVFCSENGDIISVVGDNTAFSKKIPDLCSTVHSIGNTILKNVNFGDYDFAILKGKDGNILFYQYENYCLIALMGENKELRYVTQ